MDKPTPYRIVESRTSARSLEWDRLPIVGDDRARRADRARAWRAIFAGLFVFWACVTVALIVAVL